MKNLLDWTKEVQRFFLEHRAQFLRYRRHRSVEYREDATILKVKNKAQHIIVDTDHSSFFLN